MISYLIAIPIAMIAGLLMTRALKPLKLPEVTAYLIAGVLVGPFVLGRLGVEFDGEKIWFGISEELLNGNALKLVTAVALGFIAFSIGNEFRLSELKKIGKPAVVIGILQAVAATVIVDIVLVVVHFIVPDKLSLSAAIVLGAIAAATAPAATLMVVRQYNAKGELTSLLLPIVALDDAVGLIIFAVSNGVGQALEPGGTLSVVTILANPVIEIVLSLGTGALLGVIFAYVTKLFKSRRNNVMLAITFVILAVGISKIEHTFANDAKIGFSSLLMCMMMGTVFCNMCKTSEMTMENTDRWTPIVFLLFFVISGAELDLTVFTDGIIILIGIIYILFRCVGKYVGTYGSCCLMKCSKKARTYLGITLFPQAGVALGMCAIAAETLQDGALVKSIVLFAVLVYEIAGPMLTKIALTASGDIVKELPKSVPAEAIPSGEGQPAGEEITAEVTENAEPAPAQEPVQEEPVPAEEPAPIEESAPAPSGRGRKKK